MMSAVVRDHRGSISAGMLCLVDVLQRTSGAVGRMFWRRDGYYNMGYMLSQSVLYGPLAR